MQKKDTELLDLLGSPEGSSESESSESTPIPTIRQTKIFRLFAHIHTSSDSLVYDIGVSLVCY